MFNALGEKTLYIFAACNAITIPMIWALYPETNQRTLEEIDLLFASDSIWNWEAEKHFAALKDQLTYETAHVSKDDDIEQLSHHGSSEARRSSVRGDMKL